MFSQRRTPHLTHPFTLQTHLLTLGLLHRRLFAFLFTRHHNYTALQPIIACTSMRLFNWCIPVFFVIGYLSSFSSSSACIIPLLCVRLSSALPFLCVPCLWCPDSVSAFRKLLKFVTPPGKRPHLASSYISYFSVCLSFCHLSHISILLVAISVFRWVLLCHLLMPVFCVYSYCLLCDS